MLLLINLCISQPTAVQQWPVDQSVNEIRNSNFSVWRRRKATIQQIHLLWEREPKPLMAVQR